MCRPRCAYGGRRPNPPAGAARGGPSGRRRRVVWFDAAEMAKRKNARRPHRPGPAAWLGAFAPRDGPAALALAVLVVVSYLPALQGGFLDVDAAGNVDGQHQLQVDRALCGRAGCRGAKPGTDGDEGAEESRAETPTRWLNDRLHGSASLVSPTRPSKDGRSAAEADKVRRRDDGPKEVRDSPQDLA